MIYNNPEEIRCSSEGWRFGGFAVGLSVRNGRDGGRAGHLEASGAIRALRLTQDIKARAAVFVYRHGA